MHTVTRLRSPSISTSIPASQRGPSCSTARPLLLSRQAHGLRSYQEECIQTVLNSLERGIKRQAVSLPVGSGKTVVFSNLIQRIPSPTEKATKTLILAHREELINQAFNHINTVTNTNNDNDNDNDSNSNSSIVNVHIDQGRRKPNHHIADIIIASVPTLGRASKLDEYNDRLRLYNPEEYKCIVIDEAHHSAAETYKRILKYFGVLHNNKKHNTDNDNGDNDNNDNNDNNSNTTNGSGSHIVLIGFSATIKRSDGTGLDKIYDHLTYHKSFIEMVRDGWLSDMRVMTVKTDTNLSNVPLSSQTGDLSLSHLSQTVNAPTRNSLIIKSYLECIVTNDRKSTLVFAVDVAHVKELYRLFNMAGVNAKYITGDTPSDERADILSSFKQREIPVLINCAILTEGTDIPNIDSILMARPTSSSVLFQQMLGRGLRLFDDKKDCLVVDYVDVFKHRKADLMSIPTLLGLDPRTVLSPSQTILGMRKKKNQTVDEYIYDENDAIKLNSNDGETDYSSEQNEDAKSAAAAAAAAASALASATAQSLDNVKMVLRYISDPLSVSSLSSSSSSSPSSSTVSTASTVFNQFQLESEIEKMSPFAWVKVGESKYVLCSASVKVYAEQIEASDTNVSSYSIYFRHSIKTPQTHYMVTNPKCIPPVCVFNVHGAKCTQTLTIVPSLQAAFESCERYLNSYLKIPNLASLKRNAYWRRGAATPAQLQYLTKNGINVEDAARRAVSEEEMRQKAIMSTLSWSIRNKIAQNAARFKPKATSQNTVITAAAAAAAAETESAATTTTTTAAEPIKRKLTKGEAGDIITMIREGYFSHLKATLKEAERKHKEQAGVEARRQSNAIWNLTELSV